ncbi:MAG TPA: alpha/beta fold hydrolase [Chloroflexi bacterium]|nr:alpha/beta fold hydrolase [Chloroflexota bacterium]
MIDDRTPRTAFRPNLLVRSGAAQTVLAMVRPKGIDITVDEQLLLLDGGFDYTGADPDQPVRLHGYYNASRLPGVTRGLVMILHGWEGCSHSNYNVILAQALVEKGFDAFRINLRDHGPGRHVDPYALNKGLFRATLLEEVATATAQVAQLAGAHPFYIIGASMGGNFALRLAKWHSERTPFHNLRKVVAVCPAINPARATDALDRNPGTRRYFRQRWLRSLRAKRLVNPALPDLGEIERMPLVRDMTEWFIRQPEMARVQRYHNADEYFAAYAVLGDALTHLTVRTTIITAKNDPIIPVVDFYTLTPHPLLDVQIHATGGHCGFIDAPPIRHHMADLILPELLLLDD